MKKIHFFWDNLNTMPEKYKENIEFARIHNMDHEVKVWDDKSARDLISQFNENSLKLYDSLIPPAAKSDFFRLICIYTQGGWYLDCDLKVMKRLKEHDQFSVFTRNDEDNRITNMAFHSNKGDEILKDMIEVIHNYYDAGFYNNDVWSFSGPGVFNVFYDQIPLKLPFIEHFKTKRRATFRSQHSVTSSSWTYQQDLGVYKYNFRNNDYNDSVKVKRFIDYLIKHNHEHLISELILKQTDLSKIHPNDYLEYLNDEAIYKICKSRNNLKFYYKHRSIFYKSSFLEENESLNTADEYKKLAFEQENNDLKLAYELMLIASFYKKGQLILKQLKIWENALKNS